MPFVQCLWLEVFVEKDFWATLKHLNGCHGNQSVSCDQALDKLSEKLNSKLLVQEEHGFQKGALCTPWPQELKKGLAWIVLNWSMQTLLTVVTAMTVNTVFLSLAIDEGELEKVCLLKHPWEVHTIPVHAGGKKMPLQLSL